MKYNYDNWLKGEFNDNLVVLMELKQKLSREDFNKIREKQNWTFDQVVKYSLEHYKCIFELQKENKPKDYLSVEIEITEDEINENKKIKRQVLSGIKYLDTITGKQYLKVKKEVERCEKAHKENKQAGFDSYLNENARITVLYKYLQYIKKSKQKRKELKYLELFRNQDVAKNVKKILNIREYTVNRKWQGISGNKTELLAAYYALKDKELFYPGKVTPQVKAFYKEFGLNVPGYCSERTLRNEPVNEDRDEFEIIFKHF